MRKIILLLILLITYSCSNDDDILPIIAACGVENPVEDLAWLREEINRREANPTTDMKYCFITQEEYDNGTVFLYEDCNPLIDKAFTILNCDGEILNSSESILNLGERTNKTIIWTPINFVCSSN